MEAKKAVELVKRAVTQPKVPHVPSAKPHKKITSLNSTGVVEAEIMDQCLVKLDSGMRVWVNRYDIL